MSEKGRVSVDEERFLELVRVQLFQWVRATSPEVTQDQVEAFAKKFWDKFEQDDASIYHWLDEEEIKKDWLAKLVPIYSLLTIGYAMLWIAEGREIPLEKVKSSWTSRRN